jgi:hypothetical protein
MRKPTRREWVLIALVPLVTLAGLMRDGDPAGGDAGVVGVAPAAKARAPVAGAAAAAQPPLSTPAVAAPAGAAPANLPNLPFPRVTALRVADATAEPGDAFAKRSWYVAPPPPPPPPVVKPPPPPPPSAPPLPFTYLGAQREGGLLMIFLVKGDSVLTVKQGDVLEGTYRVEGIEGTKLGLTYLPLNIRQTLEVGPQS